MTVTTSNEPDLPLLRACAKIPGMPITVWIPGGCVSGIIATEQDMFESLAKVLEHNSQDEAAEFVRKGIKQSDSTIEGLRDEAEEEGRDLGDPPSDFLYLKDPRPVIGGMPVQSDIAVASIRIADISGWMLGALRAS